MNGFPFSAVVGMGEHQSCPDNALARDCHRVRIVDGRGADSDRDRRVADPVQRDVHADDPRCAGGDPHYLCVAAELSVHPVVVPGLAQVQNFLGNPG